MTSRRCIRCGRAIDLCNGFQIARDTLAAMEGRLSWKDVREICGVCSEFFWAFPCAKERFLARAYVEEHK